MKRNQLYKGLFGFGMIAVFAGLVACNDNSDKFEMTSGTPDIKYIRLTDPEKGDSLLDQAFMETTICLVGNNLTSIHKLWFNDQPAILNTSLITDHTLIVDIPSKIPAEITNKIYMETRDGELCDYDFTVLVPSPTISSLKNEWVKAGDEAIVFGRYFVDDVNYPIQITMPGNIAVPHYNITSLSETEIHFIVPEECDGVSGQISISTLYGNSRSPFYFHDERGMLFDFDGLSPLNFTDNCWHARPAVEDENSLSGNYIQFGNGDATMSDGTWDDSNFFAEYWAGTWDLVYPSYGQGMLLHDLVDFTDWQNMSLKFEMQVPASNSWNNSAMQIIVASGEQIHIWEASWDFFNLEGPQQAPRALYRPWQTAPNGEFHTDGEWITVTIPFEAFVYNYEGGASYSSITGPESFGSFQMCIVGGGVNTEKECNPIVRVDNIRAVQNL